MMIPNGLTKEANNKIKTPEKLIQVYSYILKRKSYNSKINK